MTLHVDNATGLRLRTATECHWDAVSLGEVMLRLDPGEGRIARARSFNGGKVAASTT